jgi:two-component system, LuxR family, response regulator FixJ
MNTLASDPVFIVDDDAAARESVAALVRSHGVEAETYESAEQFLEHFNRQSSGCLVVDVRMSGMTGVQLQQRLIEQGVELPIIMITGYGDVSTAVQAMRAGACTFLEKPCNDEQLWESIEQALTHESQQRERRQQRAEIRRRLESLTDQERMVLDCLLAGIPNKVIAKQLDIGLRTVEMRRAKILKKMAAATVPELLRSMILINEAPFVAGTPLDTPGTMQLR